VDADREHEFAEFVQGSSRRLLRTAELLTGDRGRAEDLLQTALARAYLRWDRIRLDDPTAYVRRVLVNGQTDWWRRRSWREQPVGDLPERVSARDHATDVVGADALARALGALTAKERAVVVLRFYEDLSEAQIAAYLGVRPGTVKSTCARALTKLRISPDLADDSTSDTATPDSATPGVLR
jgi:RNA polymerase sigma-70 factor (sigma-E family)